MEQHEACPQGAKRMLGACRQNRHNATCAVGKEVGGGETRVVGEEEEECDWDSSLSEEGSEYDSEEDKREA